MLIHRTDANIRLAVNFSVHILPYTSASYSSISRYEDAVFHVTAMGFPPAELAATSRAYFGNINFFGGPHEHSVPSIDRNEEGFVNSIDPYMVRVKITI